MKGKIRWIPLVLYILTVTFALLSYFVSIWFILGVVYIQLHWFFGPLDWYIIVKICRKLMRVRKMKKIDVLACILGLTTGFVGLAILDVILRIYAHYGSKAK